MIFILTFCYVIDIFSSFPTFFFFPVPYFDISSLFINGRPELFVQLYGKVIFVLLCHLSCPSLLCVCGCMGEGWVGVFGCLGWVFYVC